jgi:hypothetical protein
MTGNECEESSNAPTERPDFQKVIRHFVTKLTSRTIR